MNPVSEYLTTKQAGAGDVARGFGSAMSQVGTEGFGGDVARRALGSGLAIAGTGLLALGGMAAQKLFDAATKTRDFKTMLEYNPDLIERHEANPRFFNQAFSTLRTMNPAFSKDPLVAGSYMRNMTHPGDESLAGAKAVEALTFRDKAQSPMAGEFMKTMLRGGPALASIDPLAARKAKMEEMELGHKERTAPQRHEQEVAELAHKGTTMPMRQG